MLVCLSICACNANIVDPIDNIIQKGSNHVKKPIRKIISAHMGST